MKIILRSIIPYCLTALMLAGCNGGKHESPETTTESSEVASATIILSRSTVRESGVILATVTLRPLKGIMSIPARLIANQDYEAQVGSLVQGRVQMVSANVGDNVAPGQELMRIEGVEVGEIKAQFITARAQLKFVEANLQRQKTLAEQRVGSQKSLLEAQAEYDKALAAFNAADKRIHSVGLSDDDLLTFVEPATSGAGGHTGGVLPIKSPIAGIVVERNVVIGQFVDATSTAFRIMNTSTLWADGQVYERDGARLSGKPAVTLTIPAFPAESFPGKLVYVSPLVDEHTLAIPVRALIPNRTGRLKPNMFGELRVPVGTATEGILIPEEAVQRDSCTQFVFVARNDTTFERRSIISGTTFGAMREVRSGLVPGERIVIQGSFHLKAEMMRSLLEGDE